MLLADRAVTRPPLPLVTAAEARVLRLPVSTPQFTRIRHGVYAESRALATLRPWERYALRVHAFVLAHPGAVLSHESAAVVHGLPLFGEPRDIHVHDPDRSASRRFGDVCVHTSEDPRGVVEVDGMLVTSLTVTVIDLARVIPPAHALTVVDAATSPAQGGSLGVEALRNQAAGQVNRRGVARLAWAWCHSDPLSESPGESVSRAVIEWSGFETPQLQPVFHYEGVESRCDFLFPATPAIGESDGWGKYDLSDPVAAERHLREEKLREDRLRRYGHPFGRWTLADAFRVDPLCRALRHASVRLVRSPDRARLATLRRSARVR